MYKLPVHLQMKVISVVFDLHLQVLSMKLEVLGVRVVENADE